jgi:hypothetical protein
MRIRLTDGEEEQRLIRVGKDDLLDIPGVPSQARQRAPSGSHVLDASLSLANVGHQHGIADGDQIGPATTAFQATFDRREQLPAIVELDGKELAIGADDGARKRIVRRRGIWGGVARLRRRAGP